MSKQAYSQPREVGLYSWQLKHFMKELFMSTDIRLYAHANSGQHFLVFPTSNGWRAIQLPSAATGVKITNTVISGKTTGYSLSVVLIDQTVITVAYSRTKTFLSTDHEAQPVGFGSIPAEKVGKQLTVWE